MVSTLPTAPLANNMISRPVIGHCIGAVTERNHRRGGKLR